MKLRASYRSFFPMINRTSILVAVFLLIVHCGLADPAFDQESRASGPLPDLGPGQDVRENSFILALRKSF